MAPVRLNIGEAVGEAVRFWSRSWRHAAGALGVAAVSIVIYFTAPSPLMKAASLGFYVAAAVMAQGALFRAAFADREAVRFGKPAGPGGFQWSMMETRLVLVLVLTGVLMGIVLAVGSILMAGALIGFASNGGKVDVSSPEAITQAMGAGGVLAANVVVIFALVGLCWLSVRLSLALPATAAEGRVRLISTWDLTKGNAWRILLAYMVVVAPTLLVSLLANAVAATRPDPVSSAMWLGGAASAVAVFFSLPITVGLTAFIYRRLAPNPGAAA